MVTVTITVIEARKLRDVQILGIQDPFVIISSDKESRQTKADNNGGTRPCMSIASLWSRLEWREDYKLP